MPLTCTQLIGGLLWRANDSYVWYLVGDGWKIKLRLSTGIPAFGLSSMGELGWPGLLDVGLASLQKSD